MHPRPGRGAFRVHGHADDDAPLDPAPPRLSRVSRGRVAGGDADRDGSRGGGGDRRRRSARRSDRRWRRPWRWRWSRRRQRLGDRLARREPFGRRRQRRSRDRRPAFGNRRDGPLHCSRRGLHRRGRRRGPAAARGGGSRVGTGIGTGVESRRGAAMRPLRPRRDGGQELDPERRFRDPHLPRRGGEDQRPDDRGVDADRQGPAAAGRSPVTLRCDAALHPAPRPPVRCARSER